jgi:hypothetical protein
MINNYIKKKKLKQVKRLTVESRFITIFLDSNKRIKFLWITTYIVSWILCFIFTLLSINSYFQYEVVTKIEIHNELLSKFPAVTFCNLNSFDNIDLNKIDTKNLEELSEYYTNLIKSNKSYTDKKLNWQYKLGLLSLENSMKLKYSVENYFKKIIISCTFNTVKCDPSLFSITTNGFIGNGICLTFNNNGTLETSLSGFNTGLIIEMFMNTDNKTFNQFESNGVIVTIHEPSKYTPFSKSNIISTGFFTRIAISKLSDIKLNEPYNKCKNIKTVNDFNSFLYKSTFETHNSYTQK